MQIGRGTVPSSSASGGTTGSLASTVGAANPLRYRGYYYDTETGLYYLQSRYYDPQVGRFISADAFASTGQGVIGFNMYAYCGNNPVMFVDECGQLFGLAIGTIIGAAIGGAIAGAIINTVSYIVSCGINETPVTGAGVLSAAATGAFTGAVAAVGGAAGGTVAVVASVVVGVVSGTVTAAKTEGATWQRVGAGIVAGIISGFGTYLGTKIPVAIESGFAVGVTSFAGGLMTGAHTEIISVAAQNGVINLLSSRNPLSSTVSMSKTVFSVALTA